MNYLKLAICIKNPDPAELKNQTTWLNLIYYSVGALNICTPIISAAILGKLPHVSGWLTLTVDFLFVFTSVVLLITLCLIKKSLNEQDSLALNFR
jgi:hypothetical protein